MAVLEPDFGRLIKAHSDQRELWVKKKRLMEPDLGRFNRGVNRPQPGSGCFFYAFAQNRALKQGAAKKIGEIT